MSFGGSGLSVLFQVVVDHLEFRTSADQTRNEWTDDRELLSAERLLEFNDPFRQSIHQIAAGRPVLFVQGRSELAACLFQELLDVDFPQADFLLEELAELW